MAIAPLPPNEEIRLDALNEYSVMHTTPESEFDEIAQLAAHICNTSMALIGFIDSSHEWLKAGIGLSCGASPREDSFCQYVIAQPDPLMEVPDALEDERFKHYPSVLGAPNIRFYTGVQIVAPGGGAVGAVDMGRPCP